MGSECTICVHFSKNFPGGRPWTPYCRKGISPPASIQLRVKILPHHVYQSFEDKDYTKIWLEKSTRHRQKLDSECTICIHFSKNFPGRPPDPHLQEEDINSRIYGKISPASRILERSFEDKNYAKNFGGKSTRNRQKLDSECTICTHFSKNFSGEAPDPHLQEGDIHFRSYTAKGKNSPASRISERSFEDKNYGKFFWGKSTCNRQKLDSECTICIHFSKNFPGEAPRTPTLPLRRFAPIWLRPPGSGPSGSATEFPSNKDGDETPPLSP